MIKPKVAFIVYGVHKDGLKDPMGTPFIDSKLVSNAKKALKAAGLQLVTHDVILASKEEAEECFAKLRKRCQVKRLLPACCLIIFRSIYIN